MSETVCVGADVQAYHDSAIVEIGRGAVSM